MGFKLSKKQLKAASAIGRGGVYVAPATIFLSENPIFQKKNRFLADFTTGIRRIQVKSGRGGRGGGACSLVHQPVKEIFDRLKRAAKAALSFMACMCYNMTL